MVTSSGLETLTFRSSLPQVIPG